MTDIQLAHLRFGGEVRDHNREHLVAIREARIAAEQRLADCTPARPARGGRLAGVSQRLRLALAGGSPTLADPCICPA